MTFEPNNPPPNPLLRPRGERSPARRGERPASRPLTGEVIPAGPPPELPIYDPPAYGAPLMRNPYVLAGVAIGGAILLAVFFVIFFGGGGGGANGGGNSVVGGELTPGAGGRGVASRSIATSTVREGPSAEFLEIGTLRSGQDVEVIGRNNDATWFQIYFPARSQLKGWVPSSALRVPEASINGLPVVASTPIPRPTFVAPTAPPAPAVTATPEPTETVAPTPVAGPDLIVTLQSGCAAGAPMVLTIRNSGGGVITSREIRITVATPNGLLGTSSLSLSLAEGAVASIQTDQAVQAPRTSATVDLIGSPADTNPANNAVECAVQVVGTPTPAIVSPTRPVATPPPFPTSTPTLPPAQAPPTGG